MIASWICWGDAASTTLDRDPEVQELVATDRSEADHGVSLENDEAVGSSLGNLLTPAPRNVLARERELVLREDRGEPNDRRRLLDGNNLRDTRVSHYAQGDGAGVLDHDRTLRGSATEIGPTTLGPRRWLTGPPTGSSVTSHRRFRTPHRMPELPHNGSVRHPSEARAEAARADILLTLAPEKHQRRPSDLSENRL